MKRLIYIMLAIALLLPAACSRDDSDIKEDISRVLKDNPDLVLEVLKEHSEMVYELAEKGAMVKRIKAMHSRWENDLRAPLQPDTTSAGLVMGPADAPVTIVEYSDFECAYCAVAAKNLDELLRKSPGKYRLIFKHFPLPGHRNSVMATRYVEAATMQDTAKAWQLHDALFEDQEKLNSEGEAWVIKTANDLGLNLNKLLKDAASETITARMTADMTEARSFGLNSTPTFLLNGVKMTGVLPVEVFEDFLEVSTEYQRRRAMEDAKMREEIAARTKAEAEQNKSQAAKTPAETGGQSDNATAQKSAIAGNATTGAAVSSPAVAANATAKEAQETAKTGAAANTTQAPLSTANASATNASGPNASTPANASNASRTNATNASRTNANAPANASRSSAANASAPANATNASGTNASAPANASRSSAANASTPANATNASRTNASTPAKAANETVPAANKTVNSGIPARNASEGGAVLEPIRPTNRTANATGNVNQSVRTPTAANRTQRMDRLDLNAISRNNTPYRPGALLPGRPDNNTTFGPSALPALNATVRPGQPSAGNL